MTIPIVDPGLQPERMLLSWRRTCLAFGVASAVAARFVLVVIGWPALVLGLWGILLAGVAYGQIWRRYRHASTAMHRMDRLDSGGIPLVLAWACGMLLGLACLMYVVANGLAVDAWSQ